MTIFLDSSALKSWGCHELYRQRFVENIEQLKPNVYYELGKAVHLAVESFWRGEPYEKAMDIAYQHCNGVRVDLFNPQESEHWRKQVDSLPELTAAYFDGIEYCPENLLWVEKEWSIPFNDEITLCGRMDRVMLGPSLRDVKTASEITRLGVPWKKQYREEKLLDPQFGLYDWYLCQLCKVCGQNHSYAGDNPDNHKFESMAPKECVLEVIIKPYRGSKARVELIPLNEIVTEAYRKRFRQQLAWQCAEIAEYHRKYMDQKPWPMNSNMCNSKYGTCPMAPACTHGMIPKVAELYGPRIEHLNVRLESISPVRR